MAPGVGNQGGRTCFLKEPKAEQAKKELLKEWTHVEVDSWRKMIRQQGKDPIEPEVSVRDRILWKVLTGQSSSKQQQQPTTAGSDQEEDAEESDDDQDVKVEGDRTRESGVVSFVFLRSAAAAAAVPSTTTATEVDD